jgi:hypothetical protein
MRAPGSPQSPSHTMVGGGSGTAYACRLPNSGDDCRGGDQYDRNECCSTHFDGDRDLSHRTRLWGCLSLEACSVFRSSFLDTTGFKPRSRRRTMCVGRRSGAGHPPLVSVGTCSTKRRGRGVGRAVGVWNVHEKRTLPWNMDRKKRFRGSVPQPAPGKPPSHKAFPGHVPGPTMIDGPANQLAGPSVYVSGGALLSGRGCRHEQTGRSCLVADLPRAPAQTPDPLLVKG